jgi:hypothetical protein
MFASKCPSNEHEYRCHCIGGRISPACTIGQVAEIYGSNVFMLVCPCIAAVLLALELPDTVKANQQGGTHFCCPSRRGLSGANETFLSLHATTLDHVK